MRIIDHSPDQITSYIVRDNNIRTTVTHDDLASYFRLAYHSSMITKGDDSVVFLLDERLFSYYRCSIQLTSNTPFAIGHLKQIIDDKITFLMPSSYTSACVLHRLASMSVNNQEVTHILGQIGQLSFVLEICVMQPEGVALCELLGGSSVFTHPHLSFYPRNYYTLTHLREQYTRPYALLFIEQEVTQLILVKDHRYSDVQYINIGLNLLKECYKEHDVEKYFYAKRDEVLQNSFLNKVVDEAVSFFTDTLAKRVQQYVPNQQSIMVAGDIIANPSFLPLFKDSYSAFGTSYIIPLPPVQFSQVKYTFVPKEIAVASCLFCQKDT